ncbi:MAG: hypothetical protein WCD31_02960, partial [Gillisia sp.]
AIIYGFYSVEKFSFAVFIIIAFMGSSGKKRRLDRNFYTFVALSISSDFISYFKGIPFGKEISLFLVSVAFFVLFIEALKQLNRSYREICIALSVCIYVLVLVYILSSNSLAFYDFFYYISSIAYSLFFGSLVITGIAASLYYFSSYSTKSVFFFCFTLCLILANTFHELGVIYLRDISLELTEAILRASAVIPMILFFATSEERLLIERTN